MSHFTNPIVIKSAADINNYLKFLANPVVDAVLLSGEKRRLAFQTRTTSNL
jgi:hypothetical protein